MLTLGPGWAGRAVPGLPRPGSLAEALTAFEAVLTR